VYLGAPYAFFNEIILLIKKKNMIVLGYWPSMLMFA
jgi:hypothetical protein